MPVDISKPDVIIFATCCLAASFLLGMLVGQITNQRKCQAYLNQAASGLRKMVKINRSLRAQVPVKKKK